MIDFLLVFSMFLIGLVVGLTSIGFGSLGTPVLILFFGFSPIVAAGTQLVQGIAVQVTGLFSHQNHAKINFGAAWPLVATSVPFSFMGARLAGQVDAGGLKVAIGITLVIVSAIMLTAAIKKKNHKLLEHALEKVRRKRVAFSLIAGCLIGFIIGLTSIGLGTLPFLGLKALNQMTYFSATTTNFFASTLITSAGAIAYGFNTTSEIDYVTIATMLIGSLPGVLIGSLLAPYINQKHLKFLVGTLFFVIGLKLLITS